MNFDLMYFNTWEEQVEFISLLKVYKFTVGYQYVKHNSLWRCVETDKALIGASSIKPQTIWMEDNVAGNEEVKREASIGWYLTWPYVTKVQHAVIALK